MKHTKPPYIKKGLTFITEGRGIIANCPTPQNGGVFECTANAEFIVEACNNYETLKAENAKLQESNNAMAELLKVTLKVKKEDITIMRSQCSEDEAQTWDVLNQSEISAQRITEVLQAAGITV
jgi:hypothetical protein